MMKKSKMKFLTAIFGLGVSMILNTTLVSAHTSISENNMNDVMKENNSFMEEVATNYSVETISENGVDDVMCAKSSSTEDDSNYFTVNNVQYKILTASTVAIWDATNVSGDYQIPAQIQYDGKIYSVVEIGGRAFYNNVNLTSVTMPDTIVKIQDWIYADWDYMAAFRGCTALKSVKFSKNLTHIGTGAFWEDSELTNITLPEKLETIMDQAFYGCSGITELTIPSSVTYVGQCALSQTSLVTITVPKGCAQFHTLALSEISTLMEVNVEPGHVWYCSVDGVMFTVDKSWLIIYPMARKDTEYSLPKETIGINTLVFRNNEYLKTLKLNSKINMDGLGTGLLQRSNVSAIEVLDDNPYLKSVDGVLFSKDGENLILYPPAKTDTIYFIPAGTKNIGREEIYTFEWCKYLEELYVPASVETIDGLVWSSSKLKQVVFASECKVTRLTSSIFMDCISLESICLPASMQSLSSGNWGKEFYNCPNLKVFYVAPGAGLYNCKSFGDDPFVNCLGLTVYGEGAENALSRLAEQCGRTYKDVSNECDKVLGITFKDTVRDVGEKEQIWLNAVVYPKVKANETLTYTSSDERIATVDANGKVTGVSCGTCTITAVSNDGAYARCQVQVKHQYGAPVFKWSEDGKCCIITYTCKNNASHVNRQSCIITSEIKTEATCTTKGITTYTATYGSDKDTKDVQDIEIDPSKHAKTVLVNEKKPSYNRNGYTGNVCCSACGVILKTGDILEGIKKGTIFDNGGLKYKITGKTTVTVTGLSDNSKTKVVIPDSVEYSGLKFQITAIDSKCFYKKSKIKSITIGKNVKKIGKSAFQGCKNLKTITIKSKVLNSVGKNAFKGIKKNATIKVPSSKLKSYKKTLKNKGQGKKVKIKKM